MGIVDAATEEQNGLAREDGALKQTLDFVEACVGSYKSFTMFSPSKSGVHIVS